MSAKWLSWIPIASSFDLPSSLGLMKPLPTFLPPLLSYNLMAADSSPFALDKHSRKRVISGPNIRCMREREEGGIPVTQDLR